MKHIFLTVHDSGGNGVAEDAASFFHAAEDSFKLRRRRGK